MKQTVEEPVKAHRCYSPAILFRTRPFSISINLATPD
jgi:hypothetical protein